MNYTLYEIIASCYIIALKAIIGILLIERKKIRAANAYYKQQITEQAFAISDLRNVVERIAIAVDKRYPDATP